MIEAATVAPTLGHGAAIQHTPPHVRTGSKAKPEKLTVRNLNFYYEDGNRALQDILMPIYAR